MQGVEKNNDLLSRLYFSSTNPAKNPLLKMLQRLYRVLEMNFQDEKEREAMTTFARTGVYDFVEEDLGEGESDMEDCDTYLRNDEKEDGENEDESEEQIDSSVVGNEEEDEAESLLWAPEKRFNITPISRPENRFKSFRRS